MTTKTLGPVGQLLSDPSKWTKGAMARARDERVVSPENESACKWCMMGAVIKCYGDESSQIGRNAMIQLGDAVRNHLGHGSIPTFNDRIATHADIMSILESTGL